MACSGCQKRGQTIAKVISGDLSLRQGAKQFGGTIKADARKIGSAIKPTKLGLRFK